MKISTKGRYAIRVMIDLAENNDGTFKTLTDIAARQGISEKYLEAIVGTLSRAGLVQSLRGKSGGYRLIKPADQYNMAEILMVVEGSFAPVACLESAVNMCERVATCKTLPMWEGYFRMTKAYFEGISLQSLLENGNENGDYII